MYAVTRRQFKLKLIFSWVPFMQNFFAWQLVYVELKACKTKPFIYLKDKCNFLKLLKYHTCDKLILDVDKGYFSFVFHLFLMSLNNFHLCLFSEQKHDTLKY